MDWFFFIILCFSYNWKRQNSGESTYFLHFFHDYPIEFLKYQNLMLIFTFNPPIENVQETWNTLTSSFPLKKIVCSIVMYFDGI